MLGTMLRIAVGLFIVFIAFMGLALLVFFKLPQVMGWWVKAVTLSGPDPSRRALVVYQPGLSARPREVALGLARGLNDAGFSVTVNRPGKHLPTDLSSYQVVAFGSPVYAGQASPALKRYVKSVTAHGGALVLFAVGSDPDKNEADHLAALVPAERVSIRVKFHRPAGDAAAARELGRTLGAKD